MNTPSLFTEDPYCHSSLRQGGSLLMVYIKTLNPDPELLKFHLSAEP